MSLSNVLLPVALPLGAGIVVLLVPRALRGVREVLAVLATAATVALAIYQLVRPAEPFALQLLAFQGFRFSIDLTPTPLGSFLLLFSSGFGLLVCLYSLGSMSGRPRLGEYYAFLLFAVGASGGVFFASHLLALLVLWEIVTASLYFLVASGTADSGTGATKTFVMLGGADACLLAGIGLVWLATRSFSLFDIHLSTQGWLGGIAFLLMMLAAITKAGGLPFHTWLPVASEGAPSSVMAFLPAAVDKLLGIYLLARLVTGMFVPGPGMGILLMAIGAITVLAAVMMAMVQHDLRRLLAYHAVSQVGYMVLGIGTLTPLGIAGGLFHMLNNSLYKSCLFLCGGSVEKRAGTLELDQLGGLGRVMPFTFASFLVASLAIAGVPPLNGFVSKWMIYQGALQAGGWQSYLFLIAAMFGSALTLASFVKAMYSVFLGQRSDRTQKVRGEASVVMVIPPLLLAGVCVLFGIFYRLPVGALVGASQTLSGLGGLWDSGLATILLLVGIGLGLLLYLVLWMRGKARVADPFVGGESLPPERLRASGVHFYDTVRGLDLLGRIYRIQERGWFDAHVILGKVGGAVTWCLRKLHNGMLSWYLAWSVGGVLLLSALLIWAR